MIHMRKKKTGDTIALLLVMTLLSGCNSTTISNQYEVTGNEHIEPAALTYYSALCNLYDGSMVYQKNNKSYLFDYATAESIPLCNKPNCTHTDSSCLASMSGGATLPIIYNQKVYYFTGTHEIVDAEDGMSQTMEIKSILHQGDLLTGEVSNFSEISDLDMSTIQSAVVSDNMLYVIGSYGAYQMPDSTWAYTPGSGKQYLVGIDLDNGEYSNFGLINDSPYAENSIVVEAGGFYSMGGDVDLAGVYQNKIWLQYRYTENQEDLLEELHGGGTVTEWKYEVKCFDPSTGTMTISNLPHSDCINENTYIYQDEDGQYQIIDADGNRTTADSIKAEYELVVTYVNGKLWSDGLNMCYDTASTETFRYADAYQNTMVLDNWNGAYLTYNGVSYAMASEDAFLQ